MSLRFVSCVLVIAALFGCKQRRSSTSSVQSTSAVDSSLDAVPSGLADMGYDLEGNATRALANQLAARLENSRDGRSRACASASRFMVTGPGGNLQHALKALTNEPVTYERVVSKLTLPSYTFGVCDVNGGPEDPLTAYPRRWSELSPVYGLTEWTKWYASKESKPKLTFVSVVAEDGELAGGALKSVQQWNSEGEGIERWTRYVEVKVAAADGLEAAAQKLLQELQSSVVKPEANEVFFVWAYGFAGPIALHAFGAEGDIAQFLRDHTVGLYTVASPIGGALPAILPDKVKVDTYARIRTVLRSLPQEMTPAAIDKVLKPVEWLHPNKRSEYFDQVFPKLSFGLTRDQNLKEMIGEKLHVFHVASVLDPADVAVMPRFAAEGGQLKAVAPDMSSIVVRSLLPVYQKFPLSDGIVALEHAVIPRRAVPASMRARLIGIATLNHFDMALNQTAAIADTEKDLEKIPGLPLFNAFVDTGMWLRFNDRDR